MAKVTAKRRQPATFKLKSKSSVLKGIEVNWTAVISEQGVTATRGDGRRLAISWERLLGIAMFYGLDSQRDKDTKI